MRDGSGNRERTPTVNFGYGRTTLSFDPPSAPWPSTSTDCKCEVYNGPERCPQHGLATRLGRRFNYVHNGREVPQ